MFITNGFKFLALLYTKDLHEFCCKIITALHLTVWCFIYNIFTLPELCVRIYNYTNDVELFRLPLVYRLVIAVPNVSL